MSGRPLRIMVLAGGPDSEREVSLASGSCVAEALKKREHEVVVRDAGPGDLAALGEFARWGGDLLFPVMHGPWGEGGGLQVELEKRHIPFVGSDAVASARCMAKDVTKDILKHHGLPTPEYEVLTRGQQTRIDPPVVLKPIAEGSSFGVHVCRTPEHLHEAAGTLFKAHSRILAERYVEGDELTVGLIEGAGGVEALPVIKIVPAVEYYDYEAKYRSARTRYLSAHGEMGVAPDRLAGVQAGAKRVFELMGCRDLGRVDLILRPDGRDEILEVNTMPGFTTTSLLPKAAAVRGLSFADLTDHIVRSALSRSKAETKITSNVGKPA